MSLGTAVAVALAIVLAFTIGGAIGIGWGKEAAVNAIKKFGVFMYENDYIEGTVSTYKPTKVYPPIPYPASRRPTAPSSTEMP